MKKLETDLILIATKSPYDSTADFKMLNSPSVNSTMIKKLLSIQKKKKVDQNETPFRFSGMCVSKPVWP